MLIAVTTCAKPSPPVDTYNLGWKLAMVVKGIAKPAILKTYETERRTVAQELIDFDQNYSRLWSSRPKKDMEDQSGVSMAEFEGAFVQQQLFSSGFGVHYSPNILTAKDSSETTDALGGDEGSETPSKAGLPSSHQHLASKTVLGKRFQSFKVVNHCDARSWHLAHLLKADGIFHILLFAGDVSQPSQMRRVRTFANDMMNRSRTIPLRQRHVSITHGSSLHGASSEPTDGIAQLLTIHSAPRQQVEFHDFPPLLRPFDKDLGYDYNSIFVDGESYYEGHGHAYDGYGIDRTRGCVMVVRPDHYLAWISDLEDVQGLQAYFAGFVLEQPPPVLRPGGEGI